MSTFCLVAGSINSVKLLTESTMKGAFIPLYNFVYNHTLETTPSAYFLISVALTAPLMFIFGRVFYLFIIVNILNTLGLLSIQKNQGHHIGFVIRAIKGVNTPF